jgi:hypothetical protein
VSECGVAIQVLGQKLSGGCELVSDEAEAEEPGSHGVFRIFDLRLFGAGGLDHHRHLAQCEAKLNVAFQFSGVKSASAFFVGVGELEASKLDRAVGEAGVVVEHMVAAAVVMLVSALVAVTIVPNVCQGIHRLGLSAVQLGKEILVDRVAVAVDAATVKAEGRNQKALVACHDVGEVAEGLGAVFAQSDVDVDSAHMGGVALRSGVAEVANDFLQILNVAVVENRRSHLRFLLIAVSVDAGVSGDFPFSALVVFASPSVVAAADVANCVLRAVVGGDGSAGFFSGDVIHLNLNADGLLLHFFNLDSGSFVHNMYLPFGS